MPRQRLSWWIRFQIVNWKCTSRALTASDCSQRTVWDNLPLGETKANWIKSGDWCCTKYEADCQLPTANSQLPPAARCRTETNVGRPTDRLTAPYCFPLLPLNFCPQAFHIIVNCRLRWISNKKNIKKKINQKYMLYYFVEAKFGIIITTALACQSQ